jgi:hypothetical protein
MFNQEYSITDSDELNSMTVLADCYRALPALSNSITSSFYSSPGFIDFIGKDPCSLLVSAYKLRHKLLFRECFIYVLGPWSNPRYKQLPEDQHVLIKMATDRYTEVEAKISQLFRKILEFAVGAHSNYDDRSSAQSIFGCAKNCLGGNQQVMYPSFIRLCLYHLYNNQEIFAPLLESYLVLNKSAAAGEITEGGDFRDFFLCFDIKYHELPWDISKREW